MATHSPKQFFDGQGNLLIKPYRLKDLAAIFDINQLTLKRWMDKYPDELGEKDGKYYSGYHGRSCRRLNQQMLTVHYENK